MQRQPLSNGTAAPDVFGAGDGGAALDLPPGFDLVALREGGDAFAYAQEIASQRGAGTIVFVQRFDLVEFAVVLEPDEPLAGARRAFYAGMCAMADSLAVHCPPEKPIHFDWPDTMFFDHGVIGGGRLAWPEGAAEDEPPEWLVFSGIMRTAVIRNRDSAVSLEPETSLEPGTWAVGTALEVEGFDEINPGVLVESFCRHLMTHVHSLAEKGFRSVGREWLARLPEDKSVKRGIDGNGDLLVHQAGVEGAPTRHGLVAALAECRWYDAETREPKL
jgi:Biotin/lipoate A/B protein ligase family